MSDRIANLLREERVIEPPALLGANGRIGSTAEYERLYAESLRDPGAFWSEQAKRHLHWFTPWTSALWSDFDSIGESEGPYVRFFEGGTLNASYNCLDRHLAERGEKPALVWHGEPEGERRVLTYRELHREVCRFANLLEAQGVAPGTTVTIFLPLVPEAVIAMLACARIGAIHSVVFSAFSAESLRSRIQDCGSKVVVTADAGYHAGRAVEIKPKADEALEACPTVERVIVYRRANGQVPMRAGRDIWWHEALERDGIGERSEARPFESEQPLFILYTSGSTGKPKGVLHTTGGYLLHAHLSFQLYFDHREDDRFWCTADVGWITGHSYVVYGPLSNGATCVLYEGAPLHPGPDRLWRIVEAERVTVLYTAPTAIRMLMRLGDEWPNRRDLSSLRLLGTVGEPINPEAWLWYWRTIGGERCPVVDTWWQTETGGVMISTLPAAMPMKPGSAGRPFFGVEPDVLASETGGDGGPLVINRPWPGMLRGVYGDPRNETIKRVYFSRSPGRYFTGDGARRDDDGYYWLLGRIDDVLNVSAHRLSTAELESAFVAHPAVAESAVVGYPHETRGQGIHCFVVLKKGREQSEELRSELKQHIRKTIGPIATPDRIQFAEGLPKTRSGKIMRRILRKIAEGNTGELGDTSTLADPAVVDGLVAAARF